MLKKLSNEEKQLKLIEEIAKKNDNHISYTVVEDLIKTENSEIEESALNAVFQKVQEQGIFLDFAEESEDYPEGELNDRTSFIPADVHISSKTVTVDAMISRLEYDEIELHPEFQRNSNLWSRVQQSRLIESLMLNIPIPSFYFNSANSEKWIVIDGLQRLTTLYEFFVSKQFKLEGLEFLVDFNGFQAKDLPRQYLRRINETQIQFYKVEKGTPDEVVFNIFKRINTGGLKLEPQEIRHALYQGQATRLVRELAETNTFLDATGHAIRTERMLDCEYVTRYLAFTQLDFKKDYVGNIDSFLIKALKRVNAYSMEQIELIRNEFEDVLEVCHELLGKYAFRKINKDGRRGPINKAIFEMWIYSIYHCSRDEKEKLLIHKDELLYRFSQMLEKEEIALAIKSGDKYAVANRMNAMAELLKEILDDNEFIPA